MSRALSGPVSLLVGEVVPLPHPASGAERACPPNGDVFRPSQHSRRGRRSLPAGSRPARKREAGATGRTHSSRPRASRPGGVPVGGDNPTSRPGRGACPITGPRPASPLRKLRPRPAASRSAPVPRLAHAGPSFARPAGPRRPAEPHPEPVAPAEHPVPSSPYHPSQFHRPAGLNRPAERPLARRGSTTRRATPVSSPPLLPSRPHQLAHFPHPAPPRACRAPTVC